MIQSMKKLIQKLPVKRRHQLYEERLAKQAVPYEVWMKSVLEQEKAEILGWKREAEEKGEKLPVVKIVPYHELHGCLSAIGERKETGIFLFALQPDFLVEGAAWETARYFQEHPEISIAYGDEDGWFKPGWSPDLLQSFFYFGNVFAVRGTLLENISGKLSLSGTESAGELKKCLYRLVLCCIDQVKKAGHIEKILYTPMRKDCPEQDWGMDSAFDEVKKGHIYSDEAIPEKKERQELVSIIIPSKDNPAMLSKCIHSLRERTGYQNVEIIVIDNGSTDENKNRILQIQNQLKEEYSFRYFYEPMEFNFSAMCNIGAKKAKGSYLLFLNDDIEVVREDWLSCMMKRALKSYVGAVGVKLLYPGTEKIQHAGVTSIHLGPAHKLQFSSDERIYYHGYNRCAVNVSAVTGACLLVRKRIFEQAGGFSEKLQVSFNDVELCFHIQKLGYQNVCCNDTFLYHHESVSRGADFGRKKVKRLHWERDLLYRAYPEMWNRDAYYSKKLVTDILDKGFEAAHRFEEKRVSKERAVERIDGKLDPAWRNECLYAEFEYTGDARAWETGACGGGDYYIQGYAYAVDVDNSRYKKSLLLKPLYHEDISREEQQSVTGELWKVSYEECYRPDMEEMLSYLDHPALSGISVWIKRGALPAGEYLIGSLWEDACSRQKLYRFSEEVLTVAKD